MSIDDLFDVPAPQCQLLKAYLKAAISYVPQGAYIYDDDRNALLGFTAAKVGAHVCSRSVELLRAFYCLEAAHMWLTHLDKALALGLTPPRSSERTWHGLSQLKLQLQNTRSDVKAHHTSLCLYGSSALAGNYGAMAYEQIPKLIGAMEVMEEMIDRLQPALAREEPGLSRMGTLLAMLIQSSGITSLYLVHARNLANITEENGITPWEVKELQELFSI